MRKAVLGLVVPLVLLAACEMKVGKGEDDRNDMASLGIGEDDNVSITANDGPEGVSVSVPGFDARVKVPGMERSTLARPAWPNVSISLWPTALTAAGVW